MKATGKQRAHPVLFLALSARAETKWLSGPMDGVFAELWHSGGTRDVKYWSGVDGGKGKKEWPERQEDEIEGKTDRERRVE